VIAAAHRRALRQLSQRPRIGLRPGRGALQVGPVLIRRETAHDVTAIHEVTSAAFRKRSGAEPPEAPLVARLRADPGWIPELSLVAIGETGEVIGHVVCTRGHLGETPALGLGPISVRPDRQRAGVGSALMHAVLGAADALG
jgi:putative acetyltransferase